MYNHYVASTDTESATLLWRILFCKSFPIRNILINRSLAARRNIIKSIFRTLILRDGTLCYDLNFPFNLFIEISEKETWRAQKDSLARHKMCRLWGNRNELTALHWSILLVVEPWGRVQILGHGA